MATVVVTFNSDDGTITVRYGRQVEHIEVAYKSKSQIFDSVKWACISKGATLNDIEITELLQMIGAA